MTVLGSAGYIGSNAVNGSVARFEKSINMLVNEERGTMVRK